MQQVRYDRYPAPRVTRTDDGFLRGEAVVTRTGVFRYLNADGSERLELRHPDDVHEADSLASLKMIPITIGHPGLVTSENSDDLTVGTTGETVRIDGQDIISALTITSKRGLKAIEDGEQELSLGYRLELIAEDGVFEGQRYTHRQTNIRYNHLALVRKGRAGGVARLNMDGHAVLQLKEEGPRMARINLDGIDYEASQEVINALTKAQASISTLNSDAAVIAANLVKIEAERDEHKTRADKAEADLAAANSPARFDAAVRERAVLVDNARKLGGATLNLDGLDATAIRVAALKARNPALNLDGKIPEYIEARFDAAIEQLGASNVVRQLHQVAPPVRQDSDVASGGAFRGDAATEAAAYEKRQANLNARYSKTS